jgi:uncharacterized protein (DUF1800 family)
MPLPADELSPKSAWRPFEPDAKTPFDRRLGAHLFRRAGFGASSRQLDQAVQQGPQAAANQLLAAAQDNAAFEAQMESLAQTVLAVNNAEVLPPWWLYRMRHSPAPLLEKMTLFWHGHFATSAAKVADARLMYEQNMLLRRHALGSFEALVQGIAKDPAMLLYLDSATNRKIHPNENFAREVMELFCLGLGNYTEKDIQELARCFTGWEIQHGKFKFNRYQHDYGVKTLLGKSGALDGDEGIRVILGHKATAEFICRKLVRFFVTEEEELSEAYVAPLAQIFRDSGLTVAPVVETILSSRLFYSTAAVGRKVRSPVELGVGLLRSLEATANMQKMASHLRELGQQVFYPPNVKGWAGGRTWINSATFLGRANLVRTIVEDPATRFAGRPLAAYLAEFGLSQPEQVVAWLAELLIAVPLPRQVEETLVRQSDARGAQRSTWLARLVHAVGALPEFQLA